MKNEMNYNDKVNKVMGFWNENRAMKFDSSKDFWKFVSENCREAFEVSEKVLGEQHEHAYQMGYNEEPWQNPFEVGSLDYWMANECHGQGASDV